MERCLVEKLGLCDVMGLVQELGTQCTVPGVPWRLGGSPRPGGTRLCAHFHTWHLGELNWCKERVND